MSEETAAELDSLERPPEGDFDAGGFGGDTKEEKFDDGQFDQHPGGAKEGTPDSDEYEWGDRNPEGEGPVRNAEDAAGDASKEPPAEDKPVDAPEAGGDEVPSGGSPPSLDAGLLVQAGALGLTPEEVSGFATNESLQSAISVAERFTAGQDGKPATPDEEKPWELDTSDVEPEVAEVVGKLRSHYEDRVGSLEQQLTAVIQAVQGQQTSGELEFMGEFVSGLGDNFKEVFGESGFHGTREGTPQHDNWGKLHQAWSQNYNAGIHSGRPVSRGKALEQAARMIFPEQYEQQQRSAIAGNSRKRAASASPPPSTRRAPKSGGTDKEAADFADQLIRDRGGDETVPSGFEQQ